MTNQITLSFDDEEVVFRLFLLFATRVASDEYRCSAFKDFDFTLGLAGDRWPDMFVATMMQSSCSSSYGGSSIGDSGGRR